MPFHRKRPTRKVRKLLEELEQDRETTPVPLTDEEWLRDAQAHAFVNRPNRLPDLEDKELVQSPSRWKLLTAASLFSLFGTTALYLFI